MAKTPVHKFTIGNITAAIWENVANDRTFYTVEIQRRYKDGDDWKNTASLNAGDLLNVSKVAQRSEAWIATQ